MLESARQFVPVMKNSALILLGGVTNRDHMHIAMREGFGFVAMARSLLREPDLVNRLQSDAGAQSRCNHNNKCVVTVFGRTHCVLDPDQQYGPVEASAGYSRSPVRAKPVPDQPNATAAP